MNHSLLYRIVQSAEGAQCTNSMWSALHSLGAFTHSLGALTATWIIAFNWCVDKKQRRAALQPQDRHTFHEQLFMGLVTLEKATY